MSRPRLHCALYTRKSSEEGLEQAFNSLDAQREACAAYVKSQAGEGWRAVRARYDDGGFSGASMERPALKRLLCDIEAGKVDVIVVYKIDRLTRSLADFARMIEIFDRRRVSFVSVTQAFNTTTSMGRLTLNVLLSFAQFEREVTGERIRDKIAASKAKGMWMGGTVPASRLRMTRAPWRSTRKKPRSCAPSSGLCRPRLGARAAAMDGAALCRLATSRLENDARALAVNQEEAEIVRTIFRAYVDLGSVHALQRWLEDRGIRSKRRVTRAGRLSGGRPFSRGALFHLLRNRVYRGMIVHKGRAHPGRHQAIIDGDLFAAVQARLDANTRRRASNREQKANAPLAGRLFDADGRPMSPTFSYGRGGRFYRYYVSAPLQQGARRDPSDTAIRRISAPPLEVALATVLRRLIPGCPDDPITLVVRAELHDQSLHCLLPIDRIVAMRQRLEPHERLEPDPVDARLARLHLPLVRRRGETWVLKGQSPGHMPDPVLVKALRSAHAMLHHDDGGLPVLVTAPDTPYRRQLVRLAFLAPEIQRAIVEGRQSAGVTLTQLLKGPIPLAWPQQAVQIGIATPPE